MALERFSPQANAGSAALVMAVLSQAAAFGLGRFGYGLLLPSMQAEFAVGYAAMGSIVAANLVAHTITALLVGLLAVRIGSRWVLVGALVLTGVATVATASASSVATASVFQAVAGMGTGGAAIGTNGLALSWFSQRSRGLVMGITVSGTGWGVLASGLLVPAVLSGGPDAWRTGWIVLGVPSLLMALVVWLVGRDPTPEQARRLAGQSQPVTADATSPAHPPKVGRTLALAWLAVIFLLWSSSIAVFFVFYPAAALRGGLDQAAVGRVWMAVGALSGLSGIAWGLVSDRLGRMPAMALALVIQGLGCAVLGLAAAPVWFYVAAVVFSAAGWGVTAIMNAAGPDAVGARLAPAALGWLMLGFGVGQTIGPPALGLLNDATGGFTASSLVAATLLLAGAALALLGRRLGVVRG